MELTPDMRTMIRLGDVIRLDIGIEGEPSEDFGSWRVCSLSDDEAELRHFPVTAPDSSENDSPSRG
jgi:hypothetical protein